MYTTLISISRLGKKKLFLIAKFYMGNKCTLIWLQIKTKTNGIFHNILRYFLNNREIIFGPV